MAATAIRGRSVLYASDGFGFRTTTDITRIHSHWMSDDNFAFDRQWDTGNRDTSATRALRCFMEASAGAVLAGALTFLPPVAWAPGPNAADLSRATSSSRAGREISHALGFDVTDSGTGSSVSLRASEELLAEIGRLRDGWAGDGSVAPAEAVRNDVESFLSSVNISADEIFEIEVDDQSGYVSFFWYIDENSILSVDFEGDGHANCAYTNKDSSKSRFCVISVDDERALSVFFLADELTELGLAFV